LANRTNLFDRFGLQCPSEANLRNFVTRRNFFPKAADAIARTYVENMQCFVESEASANVKQSFNTSAAAKLLNFRRARSEQSGDLLSKLFTALPLQRRPNHIQSCQLPLAEFANNDEVGPNRAAFSVYQDVCSLAEGQVTISWPSALSADSFADLQDGRSSLSDAKSAGPVKTSANGGCLRQFGF
jgi:hypothetical protein